jgi:predicted RNA polymerase sigma factor
MRLGEPAEARTYYRRYLDLAPDGNNAVFIRAMLGESDL